MTEPLQAPNLDIDAIHKAATASVKEMWTETKDKPESFRLRTIATFVYALLKSGKQSAEFRVAKFAELDARLAALEAQAETIKDFGYQGTWKRGEVFRKGNFVTDGGSLWHCESATTSRPGSNGTDWKLCVKNGAHR